MRRVLKPGGWVQMIECYYMCQSFNGSITESHAIRQWSNNYIRSISDIKNPRIPLHLKNLCTTAGFVNVDCTMIRLPLCGWSTGMNAFNFLLLGHIHLALRLRSLSIWYTLLMGLIDHFT